MEIQQAYETLSDIKTKRATINSKQQNANQDEQQTNHEELWSISTIFWKSQEVGISRYLTLTLCINFQQNIELFQKSFYIAMGFIIIFCNTNVNQSFFQLSIRSTNFQNHKNIPSN